MAIAYINSDSVLKYYDYFKDQKAVLESKSAKAEADYKNRAQSLQNDFAAYQRNVNNFTIGQKNAIEEDLTKKQQNLQLFEQSLSQQLMEEETKMSKLLYDRITAYLKKYSAEKGFQVVFKFNASSDVLYGGEALDITTPVVAGLNDEYKIEKSGGKIGSDSTSTKK